MTDTMMGQTIEVIDITVAAGDNDVNYDVNDFDIPAVTDLPCHLPHYSEGHGWLVQGCPNGPNVGQFDDEAVARRFSASWNACLGVPLNALEGNAWQMQHQIRTLLAKVDELQELAANLRRVVNPT